MERWVTVSVEGFIQQLAVSYVTHGYWFYVTGEIPPHKDPLAVDQKQHRYRALKTHFQQVAVHRTVEALAAELRTLPFAPYAPVRRQLLNLLRALNRRRKVAGLEPVPFSALRLRRRPVRPFG